MDRRQQKTRKAIFSAFHSLLQTKRYDHITVQDIIDLANVGRSTFYTHFETKDSLLESMCTDLFSHIFENDPCPWDKGGNDLESKLSHILWHIQNGESDLSGILLSNSGELFMGYFKSQLSKVFEMYSDFFKADVPNDFLINHLVGSFAETVKWWLKEDMKTPPETIAKYYISMTETEKQR